MSVVPYVFQLLKGMALPHRKAPGKTPEEEEESGDCDDEDDCGGGSGDGELRVRNQLRFLAGDGDSGPAAAAPLGVVGLGDGAGSCSLQLLRSTCCRHHRCSSQPWPRSCSCPASCRLALVPAGTAAGEVMPLLFQVGFAGVCCGQLMGEDSRQVPNLLCVPESPSSLLPAAAHAYELRDEVFCFLEDIRKLVKIV